MTRSAFVGISIAILLVPSLVVLGGCAGTENAAANSSPDAEPAVVRSAECRWAAHPIKIDGKLDEAEWQKAQVLKDFALYWQRRPAKTATKARLLWDDQFLYFSAEMEDSDLYADVKEHNGMIWSNDVIELFVKPAQDRLAYYEFQVSAANTQLELFFPSRGSGGYHRFAPLTKLGIESAVQLQGTLNDWRDKDTGWTAEGRIPLTAFETSGNRPRAGDKWRFAFCRYDYSAAFERPEISSTAPLTQSDFHRYEDYGELLFVGPSQ